MRPDLIQRTPLMTEASHKMLLRLVEHADAPKFNHATGDRLRAEDVGPLEQYKERAFTQRGARTAGEIPLNVLQRLSSLRQTSPFFRKQIPAGFDLERDWSKIPTCSREDLALAPWEFVPDDADLERLVIYRTAGTTGHPITVPHHPIAIRYYEPLIEYALSRYNAKPNFSADAPACFLVGAQIRTYTYAAVLSFWNGAGFAKLNIRQTEWPKAGSQQRYFKDLAPQFLSGDPVSFAEMMHMDLPANPTALLTTSVAMSPMLKQRLSAKYRAPVIDWYSLVETGPIGYACPKGSGYHLLPHDIHVEALKADNSPAGPGERGEITVSGGRNPYVPLLRYRTGDFGRIVYEPCECGDAMPRFLDLEGRVPVLFRSSDGTPVSTVDLSRLLREHPLLLHEFTQRADRSCELVCRALPDSAPEAAKIELDLRRVLGTLPLSIRFDEKLGERTDDKTLPYKSELLLED